MNKINFKNLTLILLMVFVSAFSQGITVTNRAFDHSEEEADEESTLSKEPKTKETNCIVKVIKIISDFEEELPGGNKQRSQQLLLKILSGHNKNKERVTVNVIPDNPAFSIIGQLDKKYLVSEIENLENGDEEYFILDYYREPYLWILSISFVILLLIVGGFKGVRSIAALLITIALVAFIMIPSIVKGMNPLLSAVLVCFLATGITMLFVAGLNYKSLAGTIGTVIGVSLSGIIATLVITFAPLSGLATSEAMILWGNQIYQINFKGLLAAGMIVSCLGAIMDVAISIASAVQEIKIANPNYSFKDFFNSGMNVGKDIMGTMTNTLVLAYTGMALPLLLLISHESNPAKYLNLELVVSEVTAALAGSIGLIVTIPATALLMAWLVNKRK